MTYFTQTYFKLTYFTLTHIILTHFTLMTFHIDTFHIDTFQIDIFHINTYHIDTFYIDTLNPWLVHFFILFYLPMPPTNLLDEYFCHFLPDYQQQTDKEAGAPCNKCKYSKVLKGGKVYKVIINHNKIIILSQTPGVTM